jgi:hypothetical protein
VVVGAELGEVTVDDAEEEEEAAGTGVEIGGVGVGVLGSEALDARKTGVCLVKPMSFETSLGVHPRRVMRRERNGSRTRPPGSTLPAISTSVLLPEHIVIMSCA